MSPPPSIEISKVLDIDQFITLLSAQPELAVGVGSVEDCTTPANVKAAGWQAREKNHWKKRYTASI